MPLNSKMISKVKECFGNLPEKVKVITFTQEFESWLQGECETPSHLSAYKEQHLVPDVDLSFDHFPEFLEARTQFMRKSLADMLNVELTNGQEFNLA